MNVLTVALPIPPVSRMVLAIVHDIVPMKKWNIIIQVIIITNCTPLLFVTLFIIIVTVIIIARRTSLVHMLYKSNGGVHARIQIWN